MSIEAFFIGNTIFLVALLVILLFFSSRNGHGENSEDLKKIKEQISYNEAETF